MPRPCTTCVRLRQANGQLATELEAETRARETATAACARATAACEVLVRELARTSDGLHLPRGVDAGMVDLWALVRSIEGSGQSEAAQRRGQVPVAGAGPHLLVDGDWRQVPPCAPVAGLAPALAQTWALLRQRGPMDGSALAALLRCEVQCARDRVQRLRALGMVTVERFGRRSKYHAVGA